jgi:hypothetical protein
MIMLKGTARLRAPGISLATAVGVFHRNEKTPREAGPVTRLNATSMERRGVRTLSSAPCRRHLPSDGVGSVCPLQLPRFDPGREEVAEARADPVIESRIRRGTLFHVDDSAEGAPAHLRWSVGLVEANLGADGERDHAEMIRPRA